MADRRLSPRTRPRRLALLVLALGGACAAPPDRPPLSQPAPLDDGRWELVTSSLVGAGRIPGVPRATLEIRHGRLAAFGGCNTATAAGHTLEGRLELAAFATTRRTCPEPLGGFEARYFKLLQSQPSLHVDGATLILSGAEHNARFRRAGERPQR